MIVIFGIAHCKLLKGCLTNNCVILSVLSSVLISIENILPLHGSQFFSEIHSIMEELHFNACCMLRVSTHISNNRLNNILATKLT